MSNTLLKLYLTEKDFGCKMKDKDNMGIAGATNEVATLKEAVAVAEKSAAVERTEREKQEARGGGGAARAPGFRGKTREFGA